MSGKLRLYKDKLEGYKKFHAIVKTIKMVTLAKYRQLQVRVRTRDMTLRYSEKAFSSDPEEKIATGLTVLVPITTNRGSCGALNSNCFRYVESVLDNTALIPVGKKGQDAFFRQFPSACRFSVINDMKAPMHFGYASFLWECAKSVPNADRYQFQFNRFISAGVQRQAVYNFPPFQKWVDSMSSAASTEDKRYLFANALLENEAEDMQDFYDFHCSLCVLNAVCENELSEQAARLVAVEGQLSNLTTLSNLTLSLYNKTRQGSITASLIEVLSAMSSLESNAAKGVQRGRFWESA